MKDQLEMEKKNIELTCQVAELKEGKLKMEKKIEELETSELKIYILLSYCIWIYILSL